MGPFVLFVLVMRQTLIACVLFFLACGGLAQSCRYTDTVNGCEYDFSSLTLQSGPPYYEFNDTDATGGAAGFYEVNICAPVTNTSCDTNSGVCQTAGTSAYNCGKAGTNFQVLPSSAPGNCTGAQLVYTDGTVCPVAGKNRQTTISLRCNAAATTAFISSIIEAAACEYVIEMQSASACGAPVVVNTTTTASPSASISLAPSPSASASASVSASASASSSALLNATASMSASASYSLTVTASPSVSPSMSMAVNGTSGNNTSGNDTTPASPSSGGGNGWIWWVVGGIAIVVLVAAVGAAGFVVYKKKQQSYDSIGYE